MATLTHADKTSESESEAFIVIVKKKQQNKTNKQ